MWERGVLGAQQMAGAFQMLRSNDLIWSHVVREYLLGERAPPSDLMAWNADATRMPFRMHADYLRNLFLNNDLAEGRYVANGRPIALSDLHAPMFVVGTERDHVAPWHSTHKIHFLADADITFVLASGGHNAGIVAPPDRSGRHYKIMRKKVDGPYIGPEDWVRIAPAVEGSWWPAWVEFLAAQSGPPVAPPAFPEVGAVRRLWPMRREPMCANARRSGSVRKSLPKKGAQRASVSAGVPPASIRGQSRSPSVMASCATAIAAVASEASFFRASMRASRVARSASRKRPIWRTAGPVAANAARSSGLKNAASSTTEQPCSAVWRARSIKASYTVSGYGRFIRRRWKARRLRNAKERFPDHVGADDEGAGRRPEQGRNLPAENAFPGAGQAAYRDHARRFGIDKANGKIEIILSLRSIRMGRLRPARFS